MTVYLDCNATTPVEPAVADELLRYTIEEFGNAGSRTHEFGLRAKRRVSESREEIANVVGAAPPDVVFTSGATEANNLALLGLARFGESEGRRHLIASAVEHKSVLEPLEQLTHRGFEVDLVEPSETGAVDVETVLEHLRPDTLCVSLMSANNETGVRQPIRELAEALQDRAVFLHVDAAQSYGKDLEALTHPRIDLIAVSGHKIYAPKGIGALITRRRKGGGRPPLTALMHGGGQERGLRPGTLPVGLIAALGTAARLAQEQNGERHERTQAIRREALDALTHVGAQINGDPNLALPTTLNVSLPGLDSEAAIVALKDVAAVSNGSACTSQSYSPSHVLTAMGLAQERVEGALRLSWSHLTPDVDWAGFSDAVGRFAVVR